MLLDRDLAEWRVLLRPLRALERARLPIDPICQRGLQHLTRIVTDCFAHAHLVLELVCFI